MWLTISAFFTGSALTMVAVMIADILRHRKEMRQIAAQRQHIREIADANAKLREDARQIRRNAGRIS